MVYGINLEGVHMNDVADAQNKLDPERLRSTTANFSGLQGLNLRGLTFAVFGASLAAMQMANVYWKSGLWDGLVDLASIGLFVASLIYVPRYYRRRFGWVRPRPASVPRWGSEFSFGQMFIRVFLLLVTFFVLWMFVHVGGRELMPLVIWFMVLCVLPCLMWFSQSKDGQRPYYIFPVLLTVIAVAFITFYPVWHWVDAKQLLLWKTLTAGSLGLGCVVLGVYDHIMLVRLIPKRVAEDGHDHE
jgi:hypothetical protein